MRYHFDVVVLGAGAAGLMCAIEAGKRGRRVAVLERANRAGKKILISGGGRCNFTNVHCRPENFLSGNLHFCKSALARYTPAEFIGLVEKHRIRYHEKTLGQLFCDGSSVDILTMLESECRQAHVEIFTSVRVQQVSRVTEFIIQAETAEFRAPALVVATGGLSIPKMGATSFGYELARQFGLRIRECRPGLVPLVFNADDRKHFSEMAGISTEVITSSRGPQRFREKLLFTHQGLSGPAILQISSYWNKSEGITVDLVPDREITAGLIAPNSRRDLMAASAALRSVLPNRLADRWLCLNPPRAWTNHALSQLEHQIHHWRVIPERTEGYDKAEVTVGGVDTDQLSAKTMEARDVPGLFFIGEIVDVTGHLGGFNFQWAWSSAVCAGRAL